MIIRQRYKKNPSQFQIVIGILKRKWQGILKPVVTANSVSRVCEGRPMKHQEPQREGDCSVETERPSEKE